MNKDYLFCRTTLYIKKIIIILLNIKKMKFFKIFFYKFKLRIQAIIINNDIIFNISVFLI